MLIRIALVLLAGAMMATAEQLILNRLVVGPPASGRSKIFISTAGTPDPHAAWTRAARKSDNSPPVSVPVTNVTWYMSSSTVALEFDPSPLSGRDPHKYGWTATYNGLLTVTLAAPEELFGVPRSKDDADVYLFGSYLAGASTKPLYSIDATVRWLPEIRDSGYFLGISGTVEVNSSTSAPLHESSADPDSLAAALALRFMRHGFLFEIEPAKGEFARRYPASSFVPSAIVKWVRDPIFSTARHAAVFYPYAGIEAGTNLNHPASLSQYGAIGRFVLRGYGAYYISKKEPDNYDPYLLEFYADYTARFLLTNEPYIKDGLQLQSDPRQYLESGIAWNVSKHVGVEAKYKHGSLPPMFEFLDHQVSVGITFKTKLPAHL
jgi:hypothetical protein